MDNYKKILDHYFTNISEFRIDLSFLKEKGEEIIYEPGSIFFLKKGEFLAVLDDGFDYYLQDGPFPVPRFRDEVNDSSFFIGKVLKGTVIGIIESYGPDIPLFYVANRKIRCIKSDYMAFEHFFTRPDNFSFLMKTLAYALAVFTDSHQEKVFGSRYEMIRSMIYRYKMQEEAGVLNESSLPRFILLRTKMSKSYLFRVLSELKKGGYIALENGKLTAILKPLPDKF